MKKLNSNHLKIIAIIAMTIDHLADLLYPNMQNNIVPIILHVIGRLTAPIMFFFICIKHSNTNQYNSSTTYKYKFLHKSLSLSKYYIQNTYKSVLHGIPFTFYLTTSIDFNINKLYNLCRKGDKEYVKLNKLFRYYRYYTRVMW